MKPGPGPKARGLRHEAEPQSRELPWGVISRVAAVVVAIAVIGVAMLRGGGSAFELDGDTARFYGVSCGAILLLAIAVLMVLLSDLLSDFTEVSTDQPGVPGWFVAALGWVFLIGMACAMLLTGLTAQ